MIKRLLVMAALPALALALAACGSSSTASGVQTAPSAGLTATPTTAATTTPLPAALSKKPVVTVPTGAPPKNLVIKDIIKGTGPAATASSTVTVQYVGVLYQNGKQFDASWNDGSGQPTSFSLAGGVIQGWSKGIAGMRVGGRRELIIPPNLAYGNKAQAKIPANSTLVFVVDLHAIS